MDIAEALAIYKISSIATKEEIQKRYKDLVKKYHPDLNADNGDWCHQRITDITEAQDILLENIPLENSHGLESLYQVIKEDEVDYSEPQPKDEGMTDQRILSEIEKIHQNIMESMDTYYQYGLENRELRKEGPRRFRFRSVQRKMHLEERKISTQMLQPEYGPYRSLLKVYFFYIQHFRAYSQDSIPKQDLSGPPYLRKAFFSVRDAAKDCESIVKDFFLNKNFPDHHKMAALQNSLQIVVVLSHTYKHGRWFESSHRFILWIESFMAFLDIYRK